MKKNYFFLLLFITFGCLNAQNDYYYYYKGQKKYLTPNKSSFYIFTNSNFETSSTASIGVEDYSMMGDNSSENTKVALIKLITEPSTFAQYEQKLNEIKQVPNIDHVGLFFENGTSEPVGITKYFYVKLKNINDYNILQQTALQLNAEIIKQVPQMPNWYIMAVSVGNSNTSLETGNQFYETGLFEAVDPAFVFNFSNGIEVEQENLNKAIPGGGWQNDATCSYDPNFSLLWGLKNDSNSNLDINACQAWSISQGQNIYVAVVDQGIYIPHLDLNANIGSPGYDAQSGTSGSVYIPGNIHGTNVAGVIAAVRNNSKDIVGVAPKSKIIPISHDLKKDTNEALVYTTISAQLASGITWAWQNELADIINNSWYSSAGWLDSQLLEEAIVNALEYGRDGKGCVVVFASGNFGQYGPSVTYPGNFDDRILTVGAMTKGGLRWFKSGYGTKLDVIAPGDQIWTTNPPSGIIETGATSMAAPHISGIAALILSVNPCLSGQQVRDIIELTSQKVGGYSYSVTTGRPNGTWNNEMGYGLADAHAAVLMAKNMLSTEPCPEGFQETQQLGSLENIAPNPSSSNVVINYTLNEANAAYLLFVNQANNSSSFTQNLDVNKTQIDIHISNYPAGFYTVALVVNGNIVDSKTLIKQ